MEEEKTAASNRDNENAQTKSTEVQGPTDWRTAACVGVGGGAIAGLIASYGSGKLAFGAFFVYMVMMIGIKGGSRKVLATVLFAAVAALVVAIW